MTETTESLIALPTKPTLAYADLEDAFPAVDCGITPYGSRIIVQIRSAKTRTDGGLYVPPEAQSTELWNTQVAKVIELGPVAFKNRDSLDPWPEGSWCQPGTYVRVPKYGGDRWEVPVSDAIKALFVTYNDLDIIGEVTGDPLKIVAFL